MTEAPPYHRGNLRDALLDRALVVLRERGEAALSLREVAREIGVSHAAPARHFADRRSLLEAVAVEGFRRLGDTIRGAVVSGRTHRAKLRGVAETYLAFMAEEGNLADVMFRHGSRADGDRIGEAASAAFAPIAELFPASDSTPDAEAPGATLFLATLQGIAALVGCGVVSPGDVPGLLDDAVPRFAVTG